jgi:DNA-binding HxlR family transcriptional regulator
MELEKFIPGISSRLLSERLKELEKEGIVIKKVYPETPIRIEYGLTKKGYSLSDTYSTIGKWAEEWI